MRAKILSLELNNFKGFKNQKFNFNGVNSTVSGANGTGKTTCATGWNWLLADRDYDLNGNPAIRPIDIEECTPSVTATIDVDGKVVTLCKMQRRTVSKPNSDGISKVSLSNTYEINSVPKTERDFKAYLEELGFDFDKTLALSHPEVFTGQKSADMRKVLFCMASSMSDLEVAQNTPGAEKVVELLGNYTLEEISAMQKATQRRILEVYGKDGELLRAKIEGLASAKVVVDVNAIEALKAEINNKITKNLEEQTEIDKYAQIRSDLSNEIMHIKFDMGDMERNASTDLANIKSEQAEILREHNRLRDSKESAITSAKSDIHTLNSRIAGAKERIAELQTVYKTEKAIKFDAKSAICPVCQRGYEADKVNELKAKFEESKKAKLDRITAEGKATAESRDADVETVKSIESQLKVLEKEYGEIIAKIDEIKQHIESLPVTVDIKNTEAYKVLEKMLASKEKELAKYDVGDKRSKLRLEHESLQSELTNCEKQIALVDGNKRIDEQITGLRKMQAEYEQAKADAEKILYQLELVGKRKNEMLTDEINSHFNLVKFEMFEYAKNGNYKECCNVYLDGRRFGESTNTGREVLAKLDIISGLQKFYGQYYPVFLDGAECLSSSTKSRIDIDTQIIYLSVNEKELEITND